MTQTWQKGTEKGRKIPNMKIRVGVGTVVITEISVGSFGNKADIRRINL